MGSVVAVIPAKANSTRLPGKNMRSFAGKPLVAYTIEQALASGEVDKVYVSTDSEEIADLARSLGADVPFLRHAELSLPNVHALFPIIDLLERTGASTKFNYAMMLLPTCPLRRVGDIDEIAKLAQAKHANVLSVVDLGKTVYHLRTIDENGQLKTVVDGVSRNFQHGDSGHVYALNASCYCGPMPELLQQQSFHAGNPFAYPMDEVTGMDIDTLAQFEKAEHLYQLRQQQEIAAAKQTSESRSLRC